MKKIRTEYMSNPEFDPVKVRAASSAAEGLCKWVQAMEIYDRVAKVCGEFSIGLESLQKLQDYSCKRYHDLRASISDIIFGLRITDF